jgi:hypothetical protein
MAIVRSLLVKIGFVTNKQSQTQVNKTIASTKKNLQATSTTAQNTVKNASKAQKSLLLLGRRMLLGWAAALYSVKKFFSFFNAVAIRALDNDSLARTIGVAREELQALNSEAQNFGFKENQFSSVLSFLDKMNRDVKNGVTSFHKLNNQLRININPEGTALDTLKTILEGVRQLDTEKSRIDFLEGLFPGSGVQLSDLSQDLDNFNKNVAETARRNARANPNIETFKAYTKAINEFTASFERFIQQISTLVLPVLTKTLDVINGLLSVREALFEYNRKLLSLDILGIAKDLSPGFQAAKEYGQPLFDAFKNGVLNAVDYLLPNPSFGQGMAPVSVTVNNDIQVPAGTTSEQAQYMTGEIERSMADMMMKVFINIQNNNPQVE